MSRTTRGRAGTAGARTRTGSSRRRHARSTHARTRRHAAWRRTRRVHRTAFAGAQGWTSAGCTGTRSLENRLTRHRTAGGRSWNVRLWTRRRRLIHRTWPRLRHDHAALRHDGLTGFRRGRRSWSRSSGLVWLSGTRCNRRGGRQNGNGCFNGQRGLGLLGCGRRDGNRCCGRNGFGGRCADRGRFGRGRRRFRTRLGNFIDRSRRRFGGRLHQTWRRRCRFFDGGRRCCDGRFRSRGRRRLRGGRRNGDGLGLGLWRGLGRRGRMLLLRQQLFQHVAGLVDMRPVDLGFKRRLLAAPTLRGAGQIPTAANMRSHLLRFFNGDGTGVGLLLGYADHRECIQNLLALDLKLPGQIVNTNLRGIYHPPFCFLRISAKSSSQPHGVSVRYWFLVVGCWSTKLLVTKNK